MDVRERAKKLESILTRIEFLEEALEDASMNYYIPLPMKINGRIITVSLFEIAEQTKKDYKKEALENFYDEVERIMSQSK